MALVAPICDCLPIDVLERLVGIYTPLFSAVCACTLCLDPPHVNGDHGILLLETPMLFAFKM